ncbi:CDP-diacylglycerol--glycerol-3-phosphate 3-phosphatidyltransferase [Pseudactinotalea sp. HY158]|uniref:CDP-diacylglycerol--glycerol-3-phosphate 3-phosphatidyltransferase n=1 Tax=Pseudactinotalea sp. HY158 TaxID=2654547 RepID=UPI00129C3EFC|nr:CDP-diacylglycerol--glycerol-3-phosphate 3-phosphatidyltransferase [Pseudactinotalea sp. HY158]QGH69865.1 CDP-diacylglycerol--glycerol-3-phosphate 3-phosphatidyltransferase [Pseudactinotalea sp. HY158]
MRTTNDDAAPRVSFVWNLPNILTLARVALVPVFIVLLVQQTIAARLWAFGVFVLASLTDRYDGHLARKYNKVTAFGTLADTIADKFLTGAAFILLSWLDAIPWWVTIVILVREVGITLLKLLMVSHEVISASAGGRLKMVLQIAGICVLLVPWADLVGARIGDWIVLLGQIVIYLALVLTVLTGIDYLVKARRTTRGIRD